MERDSTFLSSAEALHLLAAIILIFVLLEDLCLIFSVNDDEDSIPNDYTADTHVTNPVFCCQLFPYIIYHLLL